MRCRVGQWENQLAVRSTVVCGSRCKRRRRSFRTPSSGTCAWVGRRRLDSRMGRVALALIGVLAFLLVGILLESFGVPLDLTYRIACAIGALVLMIYLGRDYTAERWFRISLCLALLVNLGLFFTPLVNGPTSRGELILFAVPDGVIVLTARILTYRAMNAEQKATRTHMIAGLIAAVALCSVLFAIRA
jgi:hypothetical protein